MARHTFDEIQFVGAMDCNDEDFQSFVVGRHNISQSLYDEMVSGFFGDANITAKAFPANAINELIENDCNMVHIEWEADENTTDSNNEIELRPKESGEIIGKYSIALFRGVMRLFEPDEIHFSKAVNRDGEPTMAFKAIREESTVYCGDLTNLYP